MFRRGLFVLAGLAVIAFSAWWLESTVGLPVTLFSLVAAALVFLIFVSPVERLRVRLQKWFWLIPIAIYFISDGAARWLTHERGTVRFFELVSQIIPILLLALVVETRFLSGRAINASGQLALAVMMVLFLATGEFYALQVVVTESPSREAFIACIAALVGGTSGLLVGALAEPVD